MTDDKNELTRGLAEHFQRENELRNATGPTPIPPEMLNEQSHESVRQQAADEYADAILKKPSLQWTPAEIAYIRSGLAQWSRENRR